jgi:hypothetical protein
MQLFYPVTVDEGLKILRVRLRPDAARLDQNGNLTCYTSREAAHRKALEKRNSGRSMEEMFLVVIEFTTPGIIADLRRERPVERKPLATFKTDNRESVLLSKVAQDMLSRQGSFSLEIVPGTEDFYTVTYPDAAPEWHASMVGPRK